MATEPVPLPISQSTVSWHNSRFASVTARTSRLVMVEVPGRRGTKASSGNPNRMRSLLSDIPLSCIAKNAAIEVTHEYINHKGVMYICLRGCTRSFTDEIKHTTQAMCQHQFLKMACSISLPSLLNHFDRGSHLFCDCGQSLH